jgi:hypothetical protein
MRIIEAYSPCTAWEAQRNIAVLTYPSCWKATWRSWAFAAPAPNFAEVARIQSSAFL